MRIETKSGHTPSNRHRERDLSEDGYTEAEGYAASLRQMAIWIGDEDVPGGEIPDKDELEAAADFIDRQEAELKALRAAAVPQS